MAAARSKRDPLAGFESQKQLAWIPCLQTCARLTVAPARTRGRSDGRGRGKIDAMSIQRPAADGIQGNCACDPAAGARSDGAAATEASRL